MAKVKSGSIKPEKVDDGKVRYISIAVEVRDALIKELVKAPYEHVASLVNILARVPVNTVDKKDVTPINEEKDSAQGAGDSSDTAAQG
jgi:hypothetical protein